jgi:hypothetical protein
MASISNATVSPNVNGENTVTSQIVYGERTGRTVRAETDPTGHKM